MTATIPAETFERYALLTADEHYAMQGRAYREAARCWQEYRTGSSSEFSPAENLALRTMLRDAATSADDFYAEVTLALQARTRPEMIVR